VLSRGLPPVPAPTSSPAATTPTPAPEPVAATPQRRRAVLPVLAAVVALVAIAVVGWLAFTAGNGDGGGGADGTAAPRGGTRSSATGSNSGSGSPSKSPSKSPTEAVTADGMETFVADYLATVTSDPKSAWAQLTPGFQKASGGYGQYKGFWDTIRSAQVVSSQADPARKQVSYTVDYVLEDGGTTTDQVTLRLEGTDGAYLISGEA
jgi:hypothetical protein